MKKYSYTTKMSINDWRDFAEDDDIHFAVAKLDFLTTSTREHYNSHKHLISKEVLMEYAPSFLGKCLVSDFDGEEYQGHTENQTIVGYIYPSAMQDIEYYEDENGITHATAIGVISKIYATSVYNQFIKDGNKCNVSVEMLSGFTKETMNIVDGFDFKDCIGFDGCGVTLLGTTLQPSVKGANISITKFSDDEIKIALDKYKSIENENISDIILSKLNNIENMLNKEEIIMAEKEIKEEVVLEEVETETVLAEDNTDDKTDDVNDKTDDTENKDDDEVEKMQIKLSELEKQIADYEAEKVEYEAKITTLEKFKSDVEMAQKQEIIDTTMAKAKDLVKDMDFDTAKFEEYTNKGVECDLNNIGTWKNSVMAEVAMFAIENKKEVKETTFDMGVPNEENKYNSIYK